MLCVVENEIIFFFNFSTFSLQKILFCLKLKLSSEIYGFQLTSFVLEISVLMKLNVLTFLFLKIFTSLLLYTK